MYGALRPLLFVLPAHAAHAAAFAALGPAEHVAPLRALLRAAARASTDPRVATRVMGLAFPSPIGLAAGFDKNAHRPRSLAALGFGHLEIGTVTAQAQSANPRPNLFRLPADRALVNRLGFPNEGAERVATRLAQARPDVDVPLGISIGKSRVVPPHSIDAVVADYAAALDRVRGSADFVVVNVSSPNTLGLRALQAREHARVLLATLKERAGPTCPILVKIAPDLDEAELEDVLAVVEQVGIQGVVATNTTVSRDGLRTRADRIGSIGAGGLSGPPLRTRVVSIVGRVRARLGATVVVIGVGGVETAGQALALVAAGANLVQLYTGFVYGGPWVASRITRDLAAILARDGVKSVGELVGSEEASLTEKSRQ
jgi:dihydroorotate dehydrogenase